MNTRVWQIVAGATTVVAIIAVVFAITASTNGHDDMDMGGQNAGQMNHDMIGSSGGMDHDMMNSSGSGQWDGPMMSMGGMPGMSMGDNGMMSMDEQAFIAMMVAHHQMAIDMAQIELDRGNDAQVRGVAENVIKAQTAEIEQMRQWYQDWYGGDVPTMPMSRAMSMMGMQMDMGELRSTDDPDQLFLRMMQPHHAGAILMADMVLHGDPRQEIAELANAIIADQSAEMGSMQAMRK